MALLPHLLAAFTLAVTLSASVFGVAAGQGPVKVSAQVLRHASVSLVSQPPALVLTPADIERGYVDVSDSTELTIRCNSLAGYLLEFGVQSDFLREIKVTGLDAALSLGRGGGVAVQAAERTPARHKLVRIGFRFMLAASARAGTYAWPMRLSVTPL